MNTKKILWTMAGLFIAAIIKNGFWQSYTYKINSDE